MSSSFFTGTWRLDAEAFKEKLQRNTHLVLSNENENENDDTVGLNPLNPDNNIGLSTMSSSIAFNNNTNNNNNNNNNNNINSNTRNNTNNGKKNNKKNNNNNYQSKQTKLYYKKQNDLVESFALMDKHNQITKVESYSKTLSSKPLSTSTNTLASSSSLGFVVVDGGDHHHHHHNNNHLDTPLSSSSSSNMTRSDSYRAALTTLSTAGSSGSSNNENITATNTTAAAAAAVGERKDRILKNDNNNNNNNDDDDNDGHTQSNNDSAADRVTNLSLAVNIMLLIGKVVASYLSGSLSIIGSLVDSALDLCSGTIFFVTNRAIRKKNPYLYPAGKTRLEPVAIIILSAIMGTAALQLIIEGIQDIANDKSPPTLTTPTYVLIAAVIVSKIALYIYCSRLRHVSGAADALAVDHRNDVVSNCGALLCAWIATAYWKYADPLGAMLIALYIIYNWSQTGWEQIQLLVGKAATPEFLQQITFLCWNHDEHIKAIDTVRAFHIGNNYMVEVDIVLPEDMPLRQAHDIGEALQVKLEKLENVDRAFVHLDFEFDHAPEHQ